MPGTVVRLTQDGRQKADPVFVQNGGEVIYTVFESATQTSLMRLKLADGSVTRLHPDATTSEFELTFSRDGRYYAFIQSRGNLNLKLVLRDTQAKKDAVFDPGGGFACIRRPSFAPDGSRLVFSIPTATGQQLVTIDNQARDRKELTQSGFNNWPAWSPDGKSVAFTSSRDGIFGIYVMSSQGGQPRPLVRSSGMNIRPAWSPDSERVAFTSNRDGNYEIYTIDVDGKNLVRITENQDRDDYACWHPDGKRLIMVSERAGKSDLYLLEARG
jgi:WD40 repeat protein